MNLRILFNMLTNVLNTSITLEGYTFTITEILIFILVACLLAGFIGGMFK